jgi:hypothetical protein
MDTNIAVLLLLAFDFGAMPHCLLSDVSYSRALVVKQFDLFLTNRCLSLSSP